MKDIVSAVRRKDIWLYFAISDTRARYARSMLGPWWITLGTALGVLGLGLVWSAVMKVDLPTMLPNLSVGLVLWFMMSGIISESAGCFSNQAAIIRNYSLPLSIHTLRLLLKHLINFCHNVSIILVVFVIYGFPSFSNFAWALLGFLIILLNLSWMSLLISTLGSRFRDLGPSIDALMPVLFFLTPILYKKSDVVASVAWFDFNPIATLFSLVKNPLVSLPILEQDYLYMFILSIVGWVVVSMVFSRCKKNIVFWI
ncbi:ABC transporter permease [Pseudomonas alliivorans]|nr:ABC transporter permease [Pseudomonas alliivorans]MEE4795214.1 ABC transporter permease [Pseudomonas alliivorans]MEE4800241.1 ABC transporter permease [Pseudomonas alliivorans]MEE4808279.1 ABC transporter permease [Pseudomonas alliivorans]MEE4825270.1 ABC transporter permease [Pseudomonas alliivorans]